jgi:Phosphotransferase enzyme family
MMNGLAMAFDEHIPFPTPDESVDLLDFIRTDSMIKLPPPDPLAFTGPFPLADLAPQSMAREQIESVVALAAMIYTNGGDIPSKAVARVSDHAVVKYGTDVSLSEGRNMMTVQQQVQISMPQVYDCWKPQQRADGQAEECVYIVMQYVSGQILAQTIEDLAEDQKRDLSNQLINMLKKPHTVRHSIPGAVGGGPALAPPLFTSDGAGPFHSVADLISWFNDCLDLCQSFGRASKQQRFDDDINDLVMCHMDLHLHNLMVDGAGKLWLVDWDCAGFYPEYFDYVCLKNYADFMPPGVQSVTGAKWLQTVVDAMETSEGRRLNAKFNAISYALRR